MADEKMKNSTHRVVYFDVLNVLSCIFVVALHVNKNSWNYEKTAYWFSALAVEVLCYCAVPVFFMLSGASLLNYRSKYTTQTFFAKRLKKAVIPYIVWSLFFLLLKFRNTGFGGWKVLIEAITGYGSQPTFWFMQAVINLYLCMPLLSLLADQRYEKLRWYLILLGVASRIGIPMISQWTGISFGSYYGAFVLDGFVLYVLLGYQLSVCRISRKAVLGGVLLGILACAGRYLGTIFYSNINGELSTAFYGYNTVWALFPAVGMFLSAKMMPFQSFISEKGQMILKYLSGCSMGVYFVHTLVIEVFIKISGSFGHSILFNLIAPIFVYATSLLAVSILKKIPVVRNCVP